MKKIKILLFLLISVLVFSLIACNTPDAGDTTIEDTVHDVADNESDIVTPHAPPIPDIGYTQSEDDAVGESNVGGVDEPIAVAPPSVDTANTPSSGNVSEPIPPKPIPPVDSNFEVHYIDVGQADSALVLCDGKTMMIDGGNAEDSSLIYSYLKNRNITHLDYVIATHAHEDHIGGLSGALNFATVTNVYSPTKSYDSKTFENFFKNVAKEDAEIKIPTVGESFMLGSAEVKILGVNSTEDTNNTSIVLKITYGETTFLFTGDAEREAEEVILNSGADLLSTVLKVGHHGSSTSTTYPFLREIMPKYAVISCGKNNEYGHPHEETLSRLRDADVTVYRTDEFGGIICKSDGKNVEFIHEEKPTQNTVTPNPIVKEETPQPSVPDAPADFEYVLNTNTKKFHYPSCSSADKISEKNKGEFIGTRNELVSKGYSPCGICKP